MKSVETKITTISCYIPVCLFATSDVSGAVGAVMLSHHLEASHKPASTVSLQKIKLEHPKISTGTSSEAWVSFQRLWAAYKRGTAPHPPAVLL